MKRSDTPGHFVQGQGRIAPQPLLSAVDEIKKVMYFMNTGSYISLGSAVLKALEQRSPIEYRRALEEFAYENLSDEHRKQVDHWLLLKNMTQSTMLRTGKFVEFR